MGNPEIEKAAYLYTLKLTAYYNQEIEMGAGGVHPVVEEVRKFFHAIDDAEKMKRFYDAVISNCTFFPRKKELLEVWQSISQLEPYHPDDRRLLTMDELSGQFDLPGAFPVADIAELIDADNRKGPGEMLHEYGVKNCERVWTAQGRWCYENNTDEAYKRRKLFTLAMLGKYIEEARG